VDRERRALSPLRPPTVSQARLGGRGPDATTPCSAQGAPGILI